MEYRIRAGDTLSALAAATGVSLNDVIRANCIANPRLIAAGQVIYLPFVPMLPAAPTATLPAVLLPAPTMPPVSEPGGANDAQNDNNDDENNGSGSGSDSTNDNGDDNDDDDSGSGEDDNDNHSN